MPYTYMCKQCGMTLIHPTNVTCPHCGAIQDENAQRIIYTSYDYTTANTDYIYNHIIRRKRQ